MICYIALYQQGIRDGLRAVGGDDPIHHEIVETHLEMKLSDAIGERR